MRFTNHRELQAELTQRLVVFASDGMTALPNWGGKLWLASRWPNGLASSARTSTVVYRASSSQICKLLLFESAVLRLLWPSMTGFVRSLRHNF